MFKFVLLLGVIGLSTCFDRNGYQNNPNPTYYRGWGWGHSGHGDPYESRYPGSWHHHSGYLGGLGWFNPSQHRNTQPTKPTHTYIPYPSKGYYSDSDHQSDSDSGSEGNASSDDQDYPFSYHDSGLAHQSKTPGGAGIINGNLPQKTTEAMIPIINNPEPTTNRPNDMLETENIGQIAVTISMYPWDVQDESSNRDVPSEAGRNQYTSTGNITVPIEITSKLGNPLDNPVEKPSETNKTVNDAYITGPDDTLDRIRANQTSNDTKPMDDSKPSIIEPFSTNPTTPGPSIGSIPVASLGQFLAPSSQWNVGIYTKMETPYSQICGGSLLKSDAVLSAAHCFWSDDIGLLRPALFAVAAGKLQRAWDAEGDAYAQQSDVQEIRIPPRFQGAKTSFQDDIAILRLSKPFEYGPGVMPVCVDFDLALEREQLQNYRGTVVGWGLTEPNGPPSERLNVVRLPHLEIKECIQQAPSAFLKYITSDKICAGDSSTGFAACKADSGGGLVYTTKNIPYIRGIVSTAPRSEYACNAFTPATFTHIAAHAMFISDNILNIGEDCRVMYEDKTIGSTGTNESNVASDQMNVESDQMNVESAKTNVESDRMNVESEKTNVESDQTNVESAKTNVESDQTNVESNQMNVEDAKTNVGSDQMNVESDQMNVESDQMNVEIEQMNVESAKTNVESDQTNVESNKTNMESDNMNVTKRDGGRSNVPVPLPLILTLSPEEESNLSKCNLFLKLLGLQIVKLNTEPQKD